RGRTQVAIDPLAILATSPVPLSADGLRARTPTAGGSATPRPHTPPPAAPPPAFRAPVRPPHPVGRLGFAAKGHGHGVDRKQHAARPPGSTGSGAFPTPGP